MNGIQLINRYSCKYVILILICFVVGLNLFIGYNFNTHVKTCEKTLVLAQLAAYYEKLLEDRGITQEMITNEELHRSKKVFNVFSKKKTILSSKENTGLRELGNNLPPYYSNPTGKRTFKEQLYEQSEKHNIANLNKQKPQMTDKLNQTKAENGLVMDWWFDICIRRTTSEQLWHPLFPNYPQKTTITLETGDNDRHIGSFFRRVYGFIHVDSPGKYDFKLLSRDGAEVLLLDTNMPLNLVDKAVSVDTFAEVFHLRLTKELMDYQDNRITLSEMFETEKRNVWLKGNNLYYIEILQAGKNFAKYKIEWRKEGVTQYKMIGQENLLFSKKMSATDTPSRILKKYPLVQNFRVKDHEAGRLSFMNTPVLRSSNNKIQHSNLACTPILNDNKKISFMYQGYYQYVDNMMTYPKEFFDFIQCPQEALLIDEKSATTIAHKTFEQLNVLNNGALQLQHIVHVMANVNKSFKPYAEWQRSFFFIELDVKYIGEDTVYRSSHFIRSTPNGICFMDDHAWKENVEINLLTPIRNQKVWLKYLIHMLEDLVTQSSEKNVNLILIDNNSTDGNYEEILKRSTLKHTYLNMPSTSFSKVKALNYGLKHVTDNNSIAFVLDLHLQLPLNMFDRVRKLTILGKSAFSPSLMKLACGEHEQYTDLQYSHWLDIGTGMMAMYKADWERVGGFNEKLFDKKWGGEDWEVIDRIYARGLIVIHGRLPRFYHIHHSRDKMWDKNKS